MERNSVACASLSNHDHAGILDTRSRFEQVFLSSPRAQELYSSMRPTHESGTAVKGGRSFDDMVKMADSFHNKSSHSTSVHSLLSDQSLPFGKPKTFVDFLKDKEFEVSPFKPGVNDSAIKKKVSMVISRLEDHGDDAAISSKTRSKAKKNAQGRVSGDSGFNDMQSDSAGSGEGTFTNIINREARMLSATEEINPKKVDDNKITSSGEAETMDNVDKVYISFENSDEEVDVVTEEVQVDDEKDDKNGGDEDADVDKNHGDRNNNLSTISTENPASRSLKNSTESGEDQQLKKSRINVLKQWSIKAVKTHTHMGIIVEGQRSEDQVGDLWHSTAIVKRVNAKLVQTKSGSQYKLVGPINNKLTLQQGFSLEFVKSFKDGFPSNWLSHVADHFNSQSSSESEDEKQEQPDKKEKRVRPDSKNAKHSAATATGTPTESRAKVKGKATDLKTPENRALPKEVEIKTTRSGRMVKPPLAWWRGQRIITDRHHNLEGIDPGGEDYTPISSMYNVDIKLPLKIKESSLLSQRQFLSDDEHRKGEDRTRGNNKKKSKQSESSTEESDLPLQQETNSPKQGNSKVTLQQEKLSPNKATSTNKSQQMSTTNKHKGIKRQNNVSISSNAVKHLANSSPIGKHSHDAGAANGSFAFEDSSSSESNSEKDIVQNLKKKLFYSPKKSPNKNHQNLQGEGQKKLLDSEDKRSDKSRIQGGTPKKSDEKSDSVQRGSSKKASKSPASGDDLPNNDCIPKKNSSVHLVTEENSQNINKRSKSVPPRTDSESEGVEHVPAPKIPSPPKRILRSRSIKSNNVKSVETSDADSEDSTRTSVKQKMAKRNIDKTSESEIKASSLGEQSDSKCSKAAGKKKNTERSAVHKRVKALVDETSTQSSEDDSDVMHRKPSKKQEARPNMAKTNTITQKDSGNGRKAVPGSLRASNKTHVSKASKQAANKDAKRQQNELSDEVPWEDEEIERLNEALYAIPGNTPMFWQKISRKVGSRTAQECQLKHQGHALVSNKKETSLKKVSAKEKNVPGVKGSSQQNVKTVSGGVGTIKRKREIRELLEQQDADYEDDIFDATPFKKKKDLKLPFNLNSNSSDEDDDKNDEKEDSESGCGMSYKTPSSRTPSSRFRPLGPLSTSTTPSSEFISPSLLQQVNQKDMDHYIYRMQQGKRGTQGHGKHKAKMRTSTPKKPASSRSHLPMLSSDLFEAHPASDHDSAEEDDDYYFSDE